MITVNFRSHFVTAPSFNDLRSPVCRSRRIDQVRFSSAIVEKHRQLPQRREPGAGQHDLARRIIELEAFERHGDQFATEADEVAYAQNNKNRPVVEAENEVVDVADDVALVIDDRPQLEFVGAVALGDFLGVGCDQGDPLGRSGGGRQRQEHAREGQGRIAIEPHVSHDVSLFSWRHRNAKRYPCPETSSPTILARGISLRRLSRAISWTRTASAPPSRMICSACLSASSVRTRTQTTRPPSMIMVSISFARSLSRCRVARVPRPPLAVPAAAAAASAGATAPPGATAPIAATVAPIENNTENAVARAIEISSPWTKARRGAPGTSANSSNGTNTVPKRLRMVSTSAMTSMSARSNPLSSSASTTFSRTSGVRTTPATSRTTLCSTISSVLDSMTARSSKGGL